MKEKYYHYKTTIKVTWEQLTLNNIIININTTTSHVFNCTCVTEAFFDL